MLDGFLIVLRAMVLIAAAIFAVSTLKRFCINRLVRSALFGLIFGLAALLAMADPLMIEDGIFVDARNLFIGFAGAFAGYLGGIITFVIVAIARFFIGGAGVGPALISNLFALIAGVIWFYFFHNKSPKSALSLVYLGMGISLSVGAVLLLPEPHGKNVFLQISPYLITCYIIGSILFGMLIFNEDNFLQRNLKLILEADTDPLTSALNRRGFESKFQRALNDRSAAAENSGSVLIVFDIDNFKSVNDKYGHHTGDLVLKRVVQIVKSHLKSNDLIGRLGGDEFAVSIFNITRDEANFLVRRLQKELSFVLTNPADNLLISISVSVGAIFSPVGGIVLSDILQKADDHMRMVKGNGKDGVVFVDFSKGTSYFY